MSDDPLLDALEESREFDPTAADADDEIARRVWHLNAVVSAIAELRHRDETATPEAIRKEVSRGDDEDLPFNGAFFAELAEEFRAHGDDLNARTLEKALAWWLRQRNGEAALNQPTLNSPIC